MEQNKQTGRGLDEYIKHENSRITFNRLYTFIYILIGVKAIVLPQILAIAPIAFLCHGMINIIFLSTTPGINASDEEILEAAKKGPLWFKKRVSL